MQIDDRPAGVTMHGDNLRVEVTRHPFEIRIYNPHDREIWRTRAFALDAIYPQSDRPDLNARDDACSIGSMSGDDRQCAFMSLDLRHDEHIFGFGESAGRVDKRQTLHALWNEPALPASLKHIPFYMSTRGYGMFIHTANAVRCHVGDLEPTALSILVNDTCALDLFVIYGPDLKDILPRYTDITGTPVVPPKWTFGLWLSHAGHDRQADIGASAKALRDHNIPGDVIQTDADWQFNLHESDDRAGTIEHLRALGFRLAAKHHPNAAFYDHSNLDEVEQARKSVRNLLDRGVAAIAMDLDHSSSPNVSTRNLASLIYSRVIYDLIGEVRGLGQGVTWTNTAWVGSQCFPIHGACTSVAGIEDLAGALRAVLSLGLSGFPFCGLDVGDADPLSPEFYARWLQLGFFGSHVRAAPLPARETTENSDRTEAIFRKYVELRYRLMPYIYSEAVECGRSSLPMLRTLALEFQGDPTSIMIEDEYMFGRSLLIAPILDDSNRRNVFLPRGVWFDYWTKQPVHGGHWLAVEAPLDRLPMYVLGGAIIPYAPPAQHTGAIHLDPLSVEIYAGENTGAYTIREVDRPAITIRYEFMAKQLMLESDPTPGEVEFAIHDFGSKPQTIRADGRQGVHLLVNR
ncbi:MAG: glycoside hydrolase family 31 protein [Anaerolineae bacterium]|nr:glycoside hydrolase family 31 protein [Anaerolineae bacterium]